MKIVALMMFFVFFFLPIGLFVFILSKFLKKAKGDAWEGEVVDKLINEKRDSDSNRMERYYTVVFKTTKGEQRKMAVTADDYNNWQPGDRMKKEKGKMYPVRIK
jgi:hypothetical protein